MPNPFSIITLLFSAVFSVTGLSYGQTIYTVAGTGTAGYNGDGIAATSAQLRGSQGLAIDAAGNIYIGDIEGHRVRKVDISTGLISTVAGTGIAGYNGDGITATTAQLNHPSSLAFDAAGDLYVTDRSNYRIRKINMTTGTISTVVGTGTGTYNGDGIAATSANVNVPNDVSFDAAGNLYLADWLSNRVRKVDALTGLISTVAGTGTWGYNGDGIAATSAQIAGPCGIIFDNAGNMYFAEYNGNRIRKVDAVTGLISTVAGTGTPGYNGDGISAITAQLNGCAYIRFDGLENLYIGEGASNRIRKVDKATGLISTIAGTGTSGYNGDAIAPASAQLYNPFSIAFDAGGNLYVGDYSNNRVRKITDLPGTGLAVTLTSFTARYNNHEQILSWTTTGEINNDYFTIEHSPDGSVFEAIGIVNGSGNSSGSINYQYHIKHPQSGITYFRLKQTDNDGSFSYSKTISLSGKITQTITVYPNPSGKYFIITSAEDIKNSTLEIYNIHAERVYSRNFSEQGEGISVKTDHTLAPGIYFLKICKDELNYVEKLIVE